MTKDEAEQTGSKTYDSLTSCRAANHIGLRYTSNGGCVECCKSEKRIQDRNQWRDANQERRQATDALYTKRHKQRISAYHKQRYITVLRSERLAHYHTLKAQQSELIKDLYLGREMPVPMSTGVEDLFRQHIVWRIVNEVTPEVRVEYSSKGNRSNGQIDIFLPLLDIGIEVKLDTHYWSPALIKKQLTKYEQWLGVGNVYVTSPTGRWGLMPDQLIEKLKTHPSS